MEINKLVQEIAQIIYDKKGTNILALDVSKITSLTEAFIIAEGSVDKHVIAITKAVIDHMELRNNLSTLHVEGKLSGDWIVIDYGNIIIHLFTQELREKYAIERIWAEANIIDFKLKTTCHN